MARALIGLPPHATRCACRHGNRSASGSAWRFRCGCSAALSASAWPSSGTTTPPRTHTGSWAGGVMTTPAGNSRGSRAGPVGRALTHPHCPAPACQHTDHGLIDGAGGPLKKPPSGGSCAGRRAGQAAQHQGEGARFRNRVGRRHHANMVTRTAGISAAPGRGQRSAQSRGVVLVRRFPANQTAGVAVGDPGLAECGRGDPLRLVVLEERNGRIEGDAAIADRAGAGVCGASARQRGSGVSSVG